MSDRIFLHAIATDEKTRAELVEPLRFAASILENDQLAESLGYYLHCRREAPESAAAAAFTAAATARQLRDLAQRLCDHARISADGSCRYCGTRGLEDRDK